MHSDEILWKFSLEGFQGFKGTDHCAILHVEIRGVVVGFKIKDVFGIQIPIVLIRFKANGRWSILFWIQFS